MMKTWICLLLGAASLAGAEPIKLADGTTYQSAALLRWEGEKIILETDSGIIKVSRDDLPDPALKTLGIVTRAELAAQRAEEARVAAEKVKQAHAAWIADAPARAAREAQESKEQAAREAAQTKDREAAALHAVAARGEPPIVFGTRLPSALTRYLKTDLKDPDSFQVAEATPALEGDYEGQPCWMIAVRYRAKNSFGGYVVRTGVGYMLRGSVLAFKHDATASATAGGDVVASPDGLGGYTIRQLPRGVSRLQSVGGAFGR